MTAPARPERETLEAREALANLIAARPEGEPVPEWAVVAWREAVAALAAAPDARHTDRASTCGECGSGLLDGAHIADYACSKRAPDARLAEALYAANELERWVRKLDNALAECDAKAQKVSDHPDGDEWVGSYYLRCGPWHRVLGLRSQLAWALANWQTAALAAAREGTCSGGDAP